MQHNLGHHTATLYGNGTGLSSDEVQRATEEEWKENIYFSFITTYKDNPDWGLIGSNKNITLKTIAEKKKSY